MSPLWRLPNTSASAVPPLYRILRHGSGSAYRDQIATMMPPSSDPKSLRVRRDANASSGAGAGGSFGGRRGRPGDLHPISGALLGIRHQRLTGQHDHPGATLERELHLRFSMGELEEEEGLVLVFVAPERIAPRRGEIELTSKLLGASVPTTEAEDPGEWPDRLARVGSCCQSAVVLSASCPGTTSKMMSGFRRRM